MVDIDSLHPVFRQRHERLVAETGAGVRSAYRSTAEQAYLYACFVNCNCNGCTPANPAGSSNHEAVPNGEPMGLAVDYILPDGWTWPELYAKAAEHGIHFPIAEVEPWHGQPVEVPFAYFTGVPEMEGEAPPAPAEPEVIVAPRTPSTALRVSSQGLALIAEFEGFVDHVYRDAVGVETIGYGETRRDLIDAWRGRTMPQDEAYRLLVERAEAGYASGVRQYVVAPLYQSEFDALTSFAYNLGREIFDGATITERLNAGDYEGAADTFGLYVRAGGNVLAGLVTRRQREADLFRSEWGRTVPKPKEDEMAAYAIIIEADADRFVPVPPPHGSGGLPWGKVFVSLSTGEREGVPAQVVRVLGDPPLIHTLGDDEGGNVTVTLGRNVAWEMNPGDDGVLVRNRAPKGGAAITALVEAEVAQ